LYKGKSMDIKKDLGYLLYKFGDSDKEIVVQKLTLLEDDGTVEADFEYVRIINDDYGDKATDSMWSMYGYDKSYLIEELGIDLDDVKSKYSAYFI